MEAYTDAAGAIPELTQFHAVMRAKDQPSRLAAAAAVEHPALQARLLRGLYGNWHEQDAAAAETWLQQSGWPAETQAALREASAPLSQ